MRGVGRSSIAVLLLALAGGCANLSQAPETIVGNNTGGVIPPKMAMTQNVDSLAAAHCSKWGLQARITFPASQTGGEAVFVCEKPGQAPAAQPGFEPSPSSPQRKSR